MLPRTSIQVQDDDSDDDYNNNNDDDKFANCKILLAGAPPKAFVRLELRTSIFWSVIYQYMIMPGKKTRSAICSSMFRSSDPENIILYAIRNPDFVVEFCVSVCLFVK